MMKKYGIITGFAAIVVMMSGCDNARRNPGRAYMPDMAYSRAYETYASTEGLKEKGVRYTGMPVPGTIARDDMFPYTIANDSSGYVQSAAVLNPFKKDSVEVDLKEAGRLYMVNCGICHGAKLDGNGPLYNDGNGPYKAAPKNLLSPEIVALSDGTYFHVITYGKGAMGSYASQLNAAQRWMVISFMRSAQGKTGGADTTKAANSAVKDTTAVTGK